MLYDKDEHFWYKRAPFAGERAYTTAEELHAAAVEAFDWLVSHPLQEEVVFHHKGAIVRTTVSKVRAFTWGAVANLMGVSARGLQRYKDEPEMAAVATWIEDVIYTQKFEHAAAGLLNPSLIGRDLGLVDKSEVNSKTTVVNIQGDEANL